MHRTTLTEFCEAHGQTAAAHLLGMSQGALNKALRVKRNIYVAETADGFEAIEVRPFPCSRRHQAALRLNAQP